MSGNPIREQILLSAVMAGPNAGGIARCDATPLRPGGHSREQCLALVVFPESSRSPSVPTTA